MTERERLKQLRADRTHALNAWLHGGTLDGSPRWSDDDGRILSMADLLRMRLDLLDPLKGTAQQRATWQKIIDAEIAKWAALDAVYEAQKAMK